MSLIQSELSASGVLTVQLHNPASRNALSVEMFHDFTTALSQHGDQVKAVVFTGSGGVFSSGGDLAQMPPADERGADEQMDAIAAMVRLVTGLEVPSVAAVSGPAAGAAVGLALACDAVIADETAVFVLPFTRLGLLPDGGILSLLAARVGPARARYLLLRAEPIPAAAALAQGIVDEVAGEAALPAAQRLAGDLARRAPAAVSGTKAVLRYRAPSLEEALAAEKNAQRRLFFSADFAEGKRAFFERRDPRFTGE
jgi:enoyl-CoA hydratase/carnithine racemase